MTLPLTTVPHHPNMGLDRNGQPITYATGMGYRLVMGGVAGATGKTAAAPIKRLKVLFQDATDRKLKIKTFAFFVSNSCSINGRN